MNARFVESGEFIHSTDLPSAPQPGQYVRVHDMTREFHAEDWFTVTGYGPFASFGNEQMPDDLWDPRQMVGEEVLIDGARYRVLAAETFSVPRSPDRPYRRSFSLLVEAVDAADPLRTDPPVEAPTSDDSP
jgi:hypothetical protein